MPGKMHPRVDTEARPLKMLRSGRYTLDPVSRSDRVEFSTQSTLVVNLVATKRIEWTNEYGIGDKSPRDFSQMTSKGQVLC